MIRPCDTCGGSGTISVYKPVTDAEPHDQPCPRCVDLRVVWELREDWNETLRAWVKNGWTGGREIVLRLIGDQKAGKVWVEVADDDR